MPFGGSREENSPLGEARELLPGVEWISDEVMLTLEQKENIRVSQPNLTSGRLLRYLNYWERFDGARTGQHQRRDN